MSENAAIKTWLDSVGLGTYGDVFAENDVDLEILGDLNEQDFAALGVSLGHRKKLIRAIEKISNSPVERGDGNSVPGGDPERRYLSLMFCDLADSTRLTALLDIEEMHEINRAFQQTCTLAINKIDGFVARYMGDGILAYFGYPAAHENDAERAVLAGLEISNAISKLSAQYQLPDNMQLHVRIGIATGPVVIEVIGKGVSRESAVVGEAPNLAARLQGFASPNAVVIEPVTRNLLKKRFRLSSMGSHALKGITDSIEIWQVDGENTGESASPISDRDKNTPMIGRENELNFLCSKWQKVCAGEGQVVMLSGEAGIGKSRITQALLDHTKAQAHTRVRFFCSPYHTQTALHPFLWHIQREAGVTSSHSNKEKQQRLEKLLLDIYGFSRETLSVIASLISLELDSAYPVEEYDAVSRLNQLQAALVDFLISRSRNGPVLLVIEDAHWIDPTSKNLLDTLVSDAGGNSIYILTNSRPETNIRYNQSHVTRLNLEKLEQEDVSKMIRTIAASKGLSEGIIDSINRKSDGIPLYVEEVTRMMLESDNEGAATSARSRGFITVPDSLQASMMARLDRLEGAKKVVQVAAVIGELFNLPTLAQILGKNETETGDQLQTLVDSEVIVAKQEGEEKIYGFRHALLRDAAYDSLLKKHKKHIHAQVAQHLIKNELNVESGALDHESIAYHYQSAGEEAAAYGHWIRAGIKALDAGATFEAAGLLDNARVCVTSNPEVVSDSGLHYEFEMAHGRALNASFGAASRAAHDCFGRAVEISIESGSIAQQIDALDYQFGITFNAGELENSLRSAEQMLAIGVENDHLVARISGFQVLGMAYYALGDFTQARYALEAALDTKGEEVAGINSYPSMTLDYLSYVLFIVGESDRADTVCQQALASARKEGAYSVASALYNSSVTQYMLGNIGRVSTYSDELVNLAGETGQYMYLNRGLMLRNLASAHSQQDPESLEFVVQTIDKLLESGEEIDLTFLLGVVSELQINSSQYEEARMTLQRAMHLVVNNKEQFYLAELYRLQALIIISELRENWRQAADQYLIKGQLVAEEQGAHGWLKKIEYTKRLLA